MPDITPQLFRRMLDPLHEAEGSLRDELDQLAQAGSPDQATLLRLAQAARGHQEQAHSLLVMALFQAAPANLTVEAEALVAFFSGVVEQIEAMLAAGRG